MKVTKELKTLILNRVWDRITKENEERRIQQADLVQKLNDEIRASKEYKAREEAANAFANMVAKIAEENGVDSFYVKTNAPVARSHNEAFVRVKAASNRQLDTEVARIITRIEYGTDYTDLTSVLAEYGIEL